MKPSVVILSFNSAKSIRATVERAIALSDDVVVVDSFSSDATVSLAEALGAKIIMHAFENYGAQRNWAMNSLPLHYQWQIHLDADEWMSDELIQGIRNLPDEPSSRGFLIPRYLKFLGRVMKHGGMSPTWHLRLFHVGSALCETRKYDQHFHLKEGKIDRLPGYLIDDIQMPLSEWTARHNRWSDAEVEESRSNIPPAPSRRKPSAIRLNENAFGEQSTTAFLCLCGLLRYSCIDIFSALDFSMGERGWSSGYFRHFGSAF